MIQILCPYCHELRQEDEFRYAGQAHISRPEDPDNCTDEEWGNYLYFRKNTRGLHQEMWVHEAGCRKFFNVSRNTLTFEVAESYRIGEQPVSRESEA